MNLAQTPKFKILTSLFGKRKKKSFHVLIFNTLQEKASFDKMTFAYKHKNFGKKNEDKIEKNMHRLRYKDAVIKSFSSFKNKPITLTYYFKEEE